MKSAVIILGHGSKRPHAGDDLAGLAARLKTDAGYDIVEHAFLQYAPPSLGETVKRCIERGAERIVIVPFFVQAGLHVTKDVPEQVDRLRERYRAVRFEITAPVGSHPMMASLVTDLVDRTCEPQRGERPGE